MSQNLPEHSLLLAQQQQAAYDEYHAARIQQQEIADAALARALQAELDAEDLGVSNCQLIHINLQIQV